MFNFKTLQQKPNNFKLTLRMKNTKKKLNKQGNNVIVGFTGRKLTNYVGLVGVKKYMKKNKIFKKLNTLFPTAIYNSTQFSNTQVLMLVVFASFCKVKRFKNIETFSNDVLVQQLLNMGKSISDSRISERLKEMSEKTARTFEQYSLNQNKEFLKTLTENRITIDIDSSVKSVYGKQEGAEKGYNDKKKGLNSYHPLLSFISDYKLAFHTWFRTGNAYTSNGVEEFVKQILGNIPKNIETIFFRMDSGFFNNQLMELIEQTGHEYLIKVKFKGMYDLFRILDYQPSENRHFDIAEIDYPFSVEKEDGEKIKVCRLLRVIRKIKSHSKGRFGEDIVEYEYFCYCSNLKAKTTLEIHDIYCKRANCENWIEQVKNHLLAGATLTDNFWANDILWQLCIYAYNLSICMRLKISKFCKQEYNTFRDWFINVAGELTKTARRVTLRIYEFYIYKDDWIKMYQSI